MQIIKRGAEAVLYKSKWKGRQVVIKYRLQKRYRHKKLDDMLRSERIIREARLMHDARGVGVPVPIIYDIDLVGNKIVMEFIAGPQVKTYINKSLDSRKNTAICRKIGELVGQLHSHGIIHGDLTTSNMLLSGDRIYFLDFSLGEKSHNIEQKGVDLHLLKEAFQSAHSEKMELFGAVLTGYRRTEPKHAEVIQKIEEIEKRGRYV